jgi:hypothetical protein
LISDTSKINNQPLRKCVEKLYIYRRPAHDESDLYLEGNFLSAPINFTRHEIRPGVDLLRAYKNVMTNFQSKQHNRFLVFHIKVDTPTTHKEEGQQLPSCLSGGKSSSL